MEDKNIGKIITKTKALWLKTWKNLTPDEREELNRYEEAQRASADHIQRNSAYKEKTNAPPRKLKLQPQR